MLYSGRDAALLETLDIVSGDYTAQRGVLGVAFKSASTERRSLDVDGGREQANGTSSLGLLSQRLAHLEREVLVESRADAGGVGERGSGC
jgi:hypothetical protein